MTEATEKQATRKGKRGGIEQLRGNGKCEVRMNEVCVRKCVRTGLQYEVIYRTSNTRR
jgi:hypothetical protein